MTQPAGRPEAEPSVPKPGEASLLSLPAGLHPVLPRQRGQLVRRLGSVPMAGGAALLGTLVYLSQRSSMTKPDLVPDYR